LLANGVHTNLSHTSFPEGQTGICIVMVTPDAERSMSTFLGATANIDHSSLHAKDITKSKVYYMEGYLSASPTGLDAALKGRAIAKEAGVKLAKVVCLTRGAKGCLAAGTVVAQYGNRLTPEQLREIRQEFEAEVTV